MVCYLCHRDESYCEQMCSIFPPLSCGGDELCSICNPYLENEDSDV